MYLYRTTFLRNKSILPTKSSDVINFSYRCFSNIKSVLKWHVPRYFCARTITAEKWRNIRFTSSSRQTCRNTPTSDCCSFLVRQGTADRVDESLIVRWEAKHLSADTIPPRGCQSWQFCCVGIDCLCCRNLMLFV